MARVLLPFVLLVLGCEAWSADPDARGPDGSCAGLEGTWDVHPFEIRAYGDAEHSDVLNLILIIDAERERFTVVFERDGQRIRQSGGLVTFDDQVVLSDPLLPGQDHGTMALECGFDGQVLRMSGDTSYRFPDLDGEPEPVKFHLEAIPQR